MPKPRKQKYEQFDWAAFYDARDKKKKATPPKRAAQRKSCPPKEDFNQAAFKAIQETEKRG